MAKAKRVVKKVSKRKQKRVIKRASASADDEEHAERLKREDDREINKARVLERLRNEGAIWRAEKQAEINYKAGTTRFESRRALLQHAPIPPTKWRPGQDTGEVSMMIVDLIAHGYTFTEIRRAHPAYPTAGTFQRWCEDDPDFQAEYHKAMEMHFTSRAHLSVDVASGVHRVYDDSVTVNRDRLHSEAMLRSTQFLASRHQDRSGVHAGTWADIIAAAEEEEAKETNGGKEA